MMRMMICQSYSGVNPTLSHLLLMTRLVGMSMMQYLVPRVIMVTWVGAILMLPLQQLTFTRAPLTLEGLVLVSVSSLIVWRRRVQPQFLFMGYISSLVIGTTLLC